LLDVPRLDTVKTKAAFERVLDCRLHTKEIEMVFQQSSDDARGVLRRLLYPFANYGVNCLVLKSLVSVVFLFGLFIVIRYYFCIITI
jgi:hypothetical protein